MRRSNSRGPRSACRRTKLDASLQCSGDLTPGGAGSARSGTGSNPTSTILLELGARLDSDLGDPMVRGDPPGTRWAMSGRRRNVVNGIRTMHAQAGSKIRSSATARAAMLPRWRAPLLAGHRADGRRSDSDSRRETTEPLCSTDLPARCRVRSGPATSEKSHHRGARLLTRRPSRGSPTPNYTHNDEIVTRTPTTPAVSCTAEAARSTNEADQTSVPAMSRSTSRSGRRTWSPTTLAVDALEHSGPGRSDADRRRRPWHLRPTATGLMPASNPGDLPRTPAAQPQPCGRTPPHAACSAEPPLACYVTASCGTGGPSRRRPPRSPPSARSASVATTRRRASASAARRRGTRTGEAMGCDRRSGLTSFT